MGQILTAGQGQNPARQAAMNAGIPQEATAWGLNQLCGSGLRAVAIGLQQIANGDADIIVAGGQESMSMAPHAAHLRNGTKMGDTKFIDTMIKDGLWDAFHGYHMGTTAENVATKWQISREEQDASPSARRTRPRPRRRPAASRTRSSPSPSPTRKGDIVVDADEYPRHGATLEAMAKLRPAFSKDGTVTAGNASGINDGAAALVLMTAKEAARRGLTPLARIASWATAGVDPAIMGSGPIPATRKALEKAGWERRRSRSGRGQRGLRGAGAGRQQGPRLEPRHRQRQWRRDRDRPSDRRFRRPRAGDAAARDGQARREEGPRHALHRRRHGRRHGGGALSP